MKDKIRIAFPSDDGVSIKSRFSRSRGFVVATISSGRIIHREMRWNLLSERMTSPDGIFYNLAGCDFVITNEVGTCHSEMLEAKKIRVERTNETDISIALHNYMTSVQDPVTK
jgi:predicted Fe-Mo cluster-binding NifX family protein